MKNVRWVIQSNLLSEKDIDLLTTACNNADVEYQLVKVIPFDTNLPDFIIDSKTNIYYGSTTLIKNVYEQLNKPPGVFFNNNFSIENYIEKWGDFMLNSDALVTTFKEFIDKTVPTKIWRDDHQFFVRPDADDKSFAGDIMTLERIKNWKKNMTQFDNVELNENTKIIISEPYNLTKEWRNYIVNGKVVTSSLYRKNFVLSKSNTDIPLDMIEFCEARCKEYMPHNIFVMDIAKCGDEYYIIECGCMNSVGLYACDVNVLVNEISLTL
jgi:hypothetical protein